MNQKKCPTGKFDKNGKEILQGDTIVLSCGCCCYQVKWNEEKECWWPYDDGYSQVHEKDVNVWDCKVEICNG